MRFTRRIAGLMAAGAASGVVAALLVMAPGFASDFSQSHSGLPGSEVELDWTWSNDTNQSGTRLFHAYDNNNKPAEFTLNAPPNTRFVAPAGPNRVIPYEVRKNFQSSWKKGDIEAMKLCELKDGGKRISCQSGIYPNSCGRCGDTVEPGGMLRLRPRVKIDKDAPAGLHKIESTLQWPGQWIPSFGEKSRSLTSSLNVNVLAPQPVSVTGSASAPPGMRTNPIVLTTPNLDSYKRTIITAPKGTTIEYVLDAGNDAPAEIDETRTRAIAIKAGSGTQVLSMTLNIPTNARPGQQFTGGSVQVEDNSGTLLATESLNAEASQRDVFLLSPKPGSTITPATEFTSTGPIGNVAVMTKIHGDER